MTFDFEFQVFFQAFQTYDGEIKPDEQIFWAKLRQK